MTKGASASCPGTPSVLSFLYAYTHSKACPQGCWAGFNTEIHITAQEEHEGSQDRFLQAISSLLLTSELMGPTVSEVELTRHWVPAYSVPSNSRETGSAQVHSLCAPIRSDWTGNGLAAVLGN